MLPTNRRLVVKCKEPTNTSFVMVNVMKTVEIVETSQGQAVQLPDEFRFETSTVSIRREGDAVILEPLKPASWPEHFFQDIHIDDPAFTRPHQGSMPLAPTLDLG
jgi:virulence-associated protein VagC